MRDFWLDFGGVLDYLSGDGALLVCFRDDNMGEVLGFEVLGLLDYMGYSLDGWDYDYDCDGGLGYAVGGVKYYNRYVARSWGKSDCKVCTGDPVAWVVGSLHASTYKFEGDGRVCWVLPLDLLLFWADATCLPYIVADGCACVGGNGSYFDLSAVDNVGVDISVVFSYLFWSAFCLCYGEIYTRWLLDEFAWYVLDNGREKSDMRVTLFRNSFALNWEFVKVIGSDDDMERLRLECPSLFV